MNQNQISNLYHQSRQLMLVGQYQAALEILDQIRTSGVQHPPFLLDQILCCHKLRLPERVRDMVGELRLLSDGQGARLDFLGEELQKMGLYQHALETFRLMRDCRTDAERAVGAAREAALHLRVSSLDAAQEALDRAEFHGASYPEVRSARAMWWMRHDPPQALPILRELAQPRTGVPFPFTAAHGYHLAHVLDQLGLYDEAFAALSRAKEQELQHDPKIKAFQSQQASWRSWHADALAFSREDAKRWQDETEPYHDHAFLLGHPRSGTTLLEQVLDSHQNLQSAEETNLYSTCIDAKLLAEYAASHCGQSFSTYVGAYPESRLASLRQQYCELLRREHLPQTDTRLWLDKNPALSIAVPRMARTMPHSRIIYAQRDPRDVCISSFFLWCDRTPWSSQWLTLRDTIHQCEFTHEIWMKAKPLLAQDWTVVRYEDMVDDLVSCGRNATEFLGLEWQAQQADHKTHAAEKTVKSPTHLAVRKDIYRNSVARWKNYEKWLQPYFDEFRPLLRESGYE